MSPHCNDVGFDRIGRCLPEFAEREFVKSSSTNSHPGNDLSMTSVLITPPGEAREGRDVELCEKCSSI